MDDEILDETLRRQSDEMVSDLKAPKFATNPLAWLFWMAFGVCFVGAICLLTLAVLAGLI